MPETKRTPVHPVPLLFFLAVVALIAAYKIHGASGAVLFLLSTALFSVLIGWLIGRRWKLYPWQVGLIGAIPAALFVLWRFSTQQTPQEEADNLTLFVFHPLLVAITGHFGALLGRWQALKSRVGGNGRD